MLRPIAPIFNPPPRRGFTLLEMVTVMAILALLAGLSSFVFFGQKDVARGDRARADMQIIQQGLEAYKARFGDYPKRPASGSDTDDLSDSQYLLNALCGQIGPAGHDISGQGFPVMLNTSVLEFSEPGLPLSGIQANSIVDPWGTEYEYDYRPDSDSWDIFGYTLRSAGPDRDFSTEGDNIVAQ